MDRGVRKLRIEESWGEQNKLWSFGNIQEILRLGLSIIDENLKELSDHTAALYSSEKDYNSHAFIRPSNLAFPHDFSAYNRTSLLESSYLNNSHLKKKLLVRTQTSSTISQDCKEKKKGGPRKVKALVFI